MPSIGFLPQIQVNRKEKAGLLGRGLGREAEPPLLREGDELAHNHASRIGIPIGVGWMPPPVLPAGPRAVGVNG